MRLFTSVFYQKLATVIRNIWHCFNWPYWYFNIERISCPATGTSPLLITLANEENFLPTSYFFNFGNKKCHKGPNLEISVDMELIRTSVRLNQPPQLLIYGPMHWHGKRYSFWLNVDDCSWFSGPKVVIAHNSPLIVLPFSK